MKYKKKLRIVFIILLLILLSIITIDYFNNNDSELDKVNKLRVIVNPIYQNIRDNENYEYRDNILVTTLDLSGTVISSSNIDNHIGDILFLDEMLYMDQSYINNESDYYKIGLPLYKEEIVNGFVIFEVERNLIDVNEKSFIDNNIIALEVIIMILILILLSYILFYEDNNEFSSLIKGFENISKGIFDKVETTNIEHREMYSKYNMLVDELEFIMKKQANESNKRKVFLTMLSHELKTPLSTINAYVEGLMGPIVKDSETREKYQNVIYNKMQQLTKQIDELFKYAQEESNRFKYNFEECYGDELFNNIFDNLSNIKNNKTEVNNLIPKCIINVDKVRIEQVIMNLYNNAIKHSKETDVLKLSAYRQDQDIIIEVSDNGDGINPKDMPYIFDYYYQGKDSKENDYEGIGLGLAICKEIITKHQGSIKVRSKVGEGSKFTIQIPIV